MSCEHPEKPHRVFPAFVVCRSEETAHAWRKRGRLLEKIDIRPVVGAVSYYAVLNDIIASGLQTPALVCHDDVRCGFDFADAIASLVNDLDRQYTAWGVCGNAGIAIDGQVFRHLRDPHGGPEPGMDINPALVLDGNVLLLNVPALSAASVRLPDFPGFHGYDIALSLESWLKGLPVFCDRRLFVIHKSAGDQHGFDAFCQGEEFRRYLVSRVINHSILTLNGAIDLSDVQDFGYLDHVQTQEDRADVVAVCDRTLAACRQPRPRLTIACRTQLQRMELLERALMTFAAASLEAPELVDLDVLLVSDRDGETLAAAAEKFRRQWPGMNLKTRSVTDSLGRHSRVATLLAAIEHCQSDFIWFVDDDDFIYPASLRPIARTLSAKAPRLVVGHCRRIEEHWSPPETGPRRLLATKEIGRLPADGIYAAFSGDNFTPICGVIFPVEVLRERLSWVAAKGDYYEDYFLLLLALTSRRIEVRCLDSDFCGISLRSGENTVGETDREHWDLSYATFMNELLRLEDVGNALLWRTAGIRHPSTGTQQAPQAPWRSRLAPRLWPILARRFLLELRQAGFGATWAKVRRYLN